MYPAEIGAAVRAERTRRGLSQAELAELAGLSRETVNRLERGGVADLGVAKLATLLGALGLELAVRARDPRPRRVDHVRRATTSANVSHRDRLHADQLIAAMTTGRVPRARRALVRAALEEVSDATRDGLIAQVSTLAGDRAKVERALARLAERGVLPSE